MTDYLISLLDWACYSFECTYIVDGNWIKITSGTNSMWSFNYTDGRRFGEYTLFHKPLGRNNAHTQCKKYDICMIVWRAVAHDMYKYELQLQWNLDDFVRWKDDFNFYYKSGLI